MVFHKFYLLCSQKYDIIILYRISLCWCNNLGRTHIFTVLSFLINKHVIVIFLTLQLLHKNLLPLIAIMYYIFWLRSTSTEEHWFHMLVIYLRNLLNYLIILIACYDKNNSLCHLFLLIFYVNQCLNCGLRSQISQVCILTMTLAA